MVVVWRPSGDFVFREVRIERVGAAQQADPPWARFSCSGGSNRVQDGGGSGAIRAAANASRRLAGAGAGAVAASLVIDERGRPRTWRSSF